MKNKCGFTLVELLAVIVIIAILVMLAIPNVSKYVETSRKRAFLEDARTIVQSTKDNYLSGKYEMASTVVETPDRITYSMEGVQDTLSKKLGTGPFNSKYKDAGTVIKKVTGSYGEDRYEYYVCLIDEDGNGFDYKQIDNLSIDDIGIETDLTGCGDLPKKQYRVEVAVVQGSVDEAVKLVNEGEDVEFNLTPNSPDMIGIYNCTNDRGVTFINNVLGITNVNANLSCTVTYKPNVTVLYNDGTLIINEKPTDHQNNKSLHGGPIAEFDPLSTSNSYVFTSYDKQPWHNKKNMIKSVNIGQLINPGSTSYWFYGLTELTSANLNNLNTSDVTNMKYMFCHAGENANQFTLVGLNNWDTSNVTDMSWMFRETAQTSTSWNIGNLSNWDTSNVTNMSQMFSSAAENVSEFSLNGIGNWNISKVTNMQYMFEGSGMNSTSWSVGNLSSWNTSQVTDMHGMFSSAGKNAAEFTLGNLSNWDVSNVTNMAAMFADAGRAATTWNIGTLSNWNTSKVTNMSNVFLSAGENASVLNLNLSSWDTSKVTDMTQMFCRIGRNATTWSVGDLSNWDVSNVKDMTNMFYYAGHKARSWSIGDLSNWNVSKVTNMHQMFRASAYYSDVFNLGNLDNWDVSKVTNMIYMFSAGDSAQVWNIGNLSNWNVSSVVRMAGMFSNSGYNATTWSVGDLSNWNVSKVTDMSSMFYQTAYKSSTFNVGNLSNWNTSKVTDMDSMFRETAALANTWVDTGTLKVYADNVEKMFYLCRKPNININIYSNPSEYTDTFKGAATDSTNSLKVNYSQNTTNIDNILATKSTNSNVIKGNVLN